jgi:hypothetical protein
MSLAIAASSDCDGAVMPVYARSSESLLSQQTPGMKQADDDISAVPDHGQAEQLE